jgi:solute carrier family 30 (zinc transporter), member 9
MFSVLLALSGNLLITLLKLAGFLLSGSSALFSEAVHSFADTMNQALLLVGIKRSGRTAGGDHDYGYGQERFLWALISACGIFFLGAGVTIYHGIASLLESHSVSVTPVTFAILIASFIIEGATLYFAVRELRHANRGKSVQAMLRDGDPTTIAVIYEDGMAVIGVVIALIAITLSTLTGNVYWDSIGSIVIGVGLGVVAITLIGKNRTFLLNKSIPEDMREELLDQLASEPLIERVIDFKSFILDVGVYHVKCEIEFNGTYLLKTMQEDLRDDFDNIDGDYEEFKKFAVRLIDRVPRLIGANINKIEHRIQKNFPEIRHIDIELN